MQNRSGTEFEQIKKSCFDGIAEISITDPQFSYDEKAEEVIGSHKKIGLTVTYA